MVKFGHGEHYFRFLENVEKLREEDDSCFICGSTDNIKPHHIRRVKESDKRYGSFSNIVLLCPKHHNMFHREYGRGKGCTPSNFLKFCKIIIFIFPKNN